MRWLVRAGFAVVANAVALVLAALVLDGFELDAGSFVVAVVIFSLLSLVSARCSAGSWSSGRGRCSGSSGS